MDQARLLSWIFMWPERLAVYREQVGEAGLRRVGAALVSTLLWLPLAIPYTAFSMTGLLTLDTIALSVGCLVTWPLPVIAGWLLTSYFGRHDDLRRHVRAWPLAIALVIVFLCVIGYAGRLLDLDEGIRWDLWLPVLLAFCISLWAVWKVAGQVAGRELRGAIGCAAYALILMPVLGLGLEAMRLSDMNEPTNGNEGSLRCLAVAGGITTAALILRLTYRRMPRPRPRPAVRQFLGALFLAALMLSYALLAYVSISLDWMQSMR